MNTKPTQITLDDVTTEANIRVAIRKMRRQRSQGWGEVSPGEVKDQSHFWAENLSRQLLAGTYTPEPSKLIQVWKDETNHARGKRPLAITSVPDHVVQTAIALQLVRATEQVFLDSSVGFRPGRNQHQAIEALKRHIGGAPPLLWAVDLDFQSFFETVNHDILMRMLDDFIDDPRLLHLIRRFLTVGGRSQGARRCRRRTVGVPQGGALSPVLANLYLHPLDRMLMGSGHPSMRYADDLLTLKASRRSAKRVLDRIYEFAEGRLRLTIHPDKTSVRRVDGLEFLGFQFVLVGGRLEVQPSPKALRRLESKLDDDVMQWAGYYEPSVNSWGGAAERISKVIALRSKSGRSDHLSADDSRRP